MNSYQWWVAGDCPESCAPIGQHPEEYGYTRGDGITIVWARSAEEASNTHGLKRWE